MSHRPSLTNGSLIVHFHQKLVPLLIFRLLALYPITNQREINCWFSSKSCSIVGFDLFSFKFICVYFFSFFLCLKQFLGTSHYCQLLLCFHFLCGGVSVWNHFLFFNSVWNLSPFLQCFESLLSRYLILVFLLYPLRFHPYLLLCHRLFPGFLQKWIVPLSVSVSAFESLLLLLISLLPLVLITACFVFVSSEVTSFLDAACDLFLLEKF